MPDPTPPSAQAEAVAGVTRLEQRWLHDRHQPHPALPGICHQCGQDHPCSTLRLVLAYDASDRALVAVTRERDELQAIITAAVRVVNADRRAGWRGVEPMKTRDDLLRQVLAGRLSSEEYRALEQQANTPSIEPPRTAEGAATPDTSKMRTFARIHERDDNPVTAMLLRTAADALEAATAEVERCRAENERLRAVIEVVADAHDSDDIEAWGQDVNERLAIVASEARAALSAASAPPDESRQP